MYMFSDKRIQTWLTKYILRVVDMFDALTN